MSAPSLYTNGQLKGVSKRTEATTRDTGADSTVNSQSYAFPRVDGKVEIGAPKMDSKSTLAIHKTGSVC